MKEKPHPPMDPFLEECYRMKAEFNAQFKTMQELIDYLKAKKKEQGERLEIYIATTSQMPQTRLTGLRFCSVQGVILKAGYSMYAGHLGLPCFFI